SPKLFRRARASAGGVERAPSVRRHCHCPSADLGLDYRRCCTAAWALRRSLCVDEDRPMNIHEYQAKSLMAKFGVAVPRGAVAYTASEAEEAAKSLGGAIWAVKAQIHAGGRGKAGGIK